MGEFNLADLLADPNEGRQETHYNISELCIGDKKIKLGSFQVSEIYHSFSIALALYALQQMLFEAPVPFVVNYKDFASPPPQNVLKTGLDETSTAFVNYFTIYNGMMVTVCMMNGVLMVTAYAESESAGLEFFKTLENKIKTCNFYRGKCLHFSGEEIEFVKTPTTRWDDVIIDSELKREVQLNTENFFQNSEYRKLKLYKRGIILHGPPGTGKTSIVRAIFSSLDTPDQITKVYLTNEVFDRVDMSTFFKTLKYLLPAVVVFEDIDLIGGNRNQQRSRVIGSLLNHMDGVDKVTEPLVIIGTTNDLEALDDALRNRPARFDRCLRVGLPKPDEIKQFYSKLAGIEASRELIALSEGFTGAHIEETVNTAFMLALRDGAKREDLTSDVILQMLVTAAKFISKNFSLDIKNNHVGFGAKQTSRDDDDDDFYPPEPPASPFDLSPRDYPNSGSK